MFAIEFHYFTDRQKHPPCQGALTAEAFTDILAYLDRHYELMPAEDFFETALAGKGTDRQICLSFDDGVSSQWDVAVPCLEKAGLTGMFFCYSAHYAGKPSMIEIYHDYRFRCFSSVDAFYSRFFQLLRQDPEFAAPELTEKLRSFSYDDYLIHCPWHSYSDKLFRYTRDRLLSGKQFERLMERMMTESGYAWKEKAAALWMREDQLRALNRNGHMIGLHSHTHPTDISGFSEARQRKEYETNAKHLERILGSPVKIAAFPCGKDNADTRDILLSLGIRMAFSAEMTGQGDLMRMPRMNHPLLVKRMREQADG